MDPSFNSYDDLGLLVADVPWEPLLVALREVTGEGYIVRGRVHDWLAWERAWGYESVDDLLGGDLNGRFYIYLPSCIFAGVPDRVTALASHTGRFVLGYSHQDVTGITHATAARGDHLLRHVVDCAGHAPDHVEGATLPGETAQRNISSKQGLQAVLRAHGFDVEGWLERGEKWNVRHVRLDRERQPEAHARLYFGPLRQHVNAQEEAGLDADDPDGLYHANDTIQAWRPPPKEQLPLPGFEHPAGEP